MFHLSYQVELWNEMSLKEASAHQAQKESKKQKKQKKKQKEKERKKASTQQKSSKKEAPATSSAGAEASAAAGNGDNHELRSSASDEAERHSSPGDCELFAKASQAPIPNPSPTSVDKLLERRVQRDAQREHLPDSPERSTAAASSAGNRSRRKNQNGSKEGAAASALNVAAAPEVQEEQASGAARTRKLRKARADDVQVKATQTSGNAFAEKDGYARSSSRAALLGEGAQEGKSDPHSHMSAYGGDSKHDNQLSKSHIAIGTTASEEALLDANDELVDFLEETGSILALAAKLDLVYDG